jgi:iron complex outermembrane receptor protein
MMKKKLLKNVFCVIATLFSFAVFAQNTVSGVVTHNSVPIPGVNVVEKGTTKGAVTGFDGDYSINVAENATLVFSYVGFKTVEVKVNGQSTIDITLEEDIASLDEVIIVGYGTTTKKDQTGAVESVSAKDFNKGVQTNATELIQGRTAGVQVTTSSGEPGGGANIRIRGGATLRAGGNDPLYVVDGMLLSSSSPSAGGADIGFGSSSGKNPLNFINPNDIENISILKDASATAIYGARGANGVVIITTKKGKFGEPSISYNTTFGVGEIANSIDLLNGNQYRAALSSEGGATANDYGGNVDALDAISQTALATNHNLSILGGGEKSKYRYSVSAFDQEGVLEKSRLRNYSASMSNSYRFLKDDRLKLDVNLIASYTKDDRLPITNDADFNGNLIGAALFWNPTAPLRNSDGSFRQRQPGTFDNTGAAFSNNPLAILNLTNIQEESSRIVGNIAATYTIIDGLDYKFNFGVDRGESNNRSNTSRNLDIEGIFGRGIAANSNIITFSNLIEHTLSYKKQFSDNFNINALAGYGFQRFQARGYTAQGENIGLDPGNTNDFLNGFNEREISSFKDPTSDLESWFGRAVFNFHEKYSVTATFRADGSNKFGANNEWGYFPALAAAWRVDEEDFVPEFFDQLKVRASWGQSGNQNFPAGASLTRFLVGNDNDGSTTAQQATTANPNLQWEVNETINFGVDFAFLNNRLSGSIDIFKRDTDQLLFLADAIQPAPAGTRIWTNIDGVVVNEGLEITLFGDIINTEDWSFTLGGNFSFLRNELQDFEGGIPTGNIDGAGLTGNFSQFIVDGQPINSFFMPEFAGFNSDGLPQYLDSAGNLTTNASTEAESRFVGDPNPNLIVGLNASLAYKNFDVTVNMNGAFGHQLYNNTANTLFKGNLNNGRNILPGLVGNGEDVASTNAVSTRFLEDADFLRLNNLTFGYNFDEDRLPAYIKGLRIFATGQNLFVITDYSGFDPEVDTIKARDGVTSFGIDYQSFPRARTFAVGLNVSL